MASRDKKPQSIYRRLYASILTSPGLCKCSKLAHSYAGMMLEVVNMWGRCNGSPKWACNALFEGRDDGDVVEVSGWLDEWERAGFIERYDLDGRCFIQITNWDKHQPDCVKSRRECREPIPPNPANSTPTPPDIHPESTPTPPESNTESTPRDKREEKREEGGRTGDPSPSFIPSKPLETHHNPPIPQKPPEVPSIRTRRSILEDSVLAAFEDACCARWTEKSRDELAARRKVLSDSECLAIIAQAKDEGLFHDWEILRRMRESVEAKKKPPNGKPAYVPPKEVILPFRFPGQCLPPICSVDEVTP